MELITRRAQQTKVQQNYMLAILACVLTALLAGLLSHHVDLANIVMIFLLAVFLISVKLGRGPGVMATFLSVALFDFFFVPPKLSFTVNDFQYLLTFAVMFAVALITGQLAARLSLEAELSRQREEKTRALYDMARELTAVLKLDEVDVVSSKFLSSVAGLHGVLLFADEQNVLSPVKPSKVWYEAHIAHAACHNAKTVDGRYVVAETDGVYYFPLIGSGGVRGVLVVELPIDLQPMDEALRELLMTMVSMLAAVVERLHYGQAVQASEMNIASERLRSSILSALSHDLRTPLTVLVGMVDSLLLSKPELTIKQKELAATVHNQAMRLNHMVTNLLDMARLHTGNINMRKSWQPLEEVIGASIQLLGDSLARHPVTVKLAADLPLLEFDEILLERVFCNLLENAAKYSPLDSPITISAELVADDVLISVIDHGPGVAETRLENIFRIFVRGDAESTSHISGTGIGLAVCKAIVEAHGGSMQVNNQPNGGACFSFSLPLGNPPVLDLAILQGGAT